MEFYQKFKSWSTLIFMSAFIIVLTYIWYITFPASLWEETPNYFKMYIEFIISRPLDAFLWVSAGPRIGWLFIPVYSLIIIHIILYIVGIRKRKQYTIVNKYYIIYLIILGPFTISFQNVSQHYNWYWNSDLNAPGYIDTWTHITSPLLLGSLIAPLALERNVSWERKSMWFLIFAALTTTSLVWEIGETLDIGGKPSQTYFNFPMDSLKDIVMGGGIATILSCWIYERLVMDFE